MTLPPSLSSTEDSGAFQGFLFQGSFQTKRVKLDSRGWLERIQRHPYSDIGLAVAPEGLYLSILAIKDARERIRGRREHRRSAAPAMADLSVWADPPPAQKDEEHGPLACQLDFQVGKPPLRGWVPPEAFLRQRYAERLWAILKNLRIQCRTVAVDISLIRSMSREDKRTIGIFCRSFMAEVLRTDGKCLRLPTMQQWNSELLAFREQVGIHGPGPGPGEQALADCPTCWLPIPMNVDCETGTPLEPDTLCPRCHLGWAPGFILAEQARIHCTEWWVPDDQYSLG